MRLAFALLLTLVAFAGPLAAQSLYADPLARRAGDLITVVLAERTAAQRGSTYEDNANASAGGTASLGTLGGRFGADAQVAQAAEARNRTVQSDLLSGTVTVVVQEVDAAGNLVIAGERLLDVNGVSHRLRVRGLVRPTDVRAGNTVFSYQIANAQVDYVQTGGFRRRLLNPATLVRAGLVAVTIGAAVFGASRLAGGAPASPAADGP